MDERIRHTYLKSMGIQLWYPRLVLPNAKPSPQRRLISPVGEARNRMRKTDVTASQAKEDIAGVLSGGHAPIVSNDLKSPGAGTGDVTRFKLCLFYTEPGCCVVFEVPLQYMELDSRRLKLVEDISQALGSHRQKKTVVFQQWPMIKTRNVIQSDADAQVVVQEKLSQLIGDRRNTVVIMGEGAARYLPVEAGALKLREDLSAVDVSKTVAGVNPGVEEMLQGPIQKRDGCGRQGCSRLAGGSVG